MTRSGARQAQIAVVADAVRRHPGMTSAALVAVCSLDRHAIARRLPDAETAGLVRKGDAVRQPNGRRAVTWWPVDAGNKKAGVYGRRPLNLEQVTMTERSVSDAPADNQAEASTPDLFDAIDAEVAADDAKEVA